MLDGLILHVVLTMLLVIAAIVAIVWFVWGLKEKSIMWIVVLAVPIGLIVTVILAMFT